MNELKPQKPRRRIPAGPGGLGWNQAWAAVPAGLDLIAHTVERSDGIDRHGLPVDDDVFGVEFEAGDAAAPPAKKSIPRKPTANKVAETAAEIIAKKSVKKAAKKARPFRAARASIRNIGF